MIEELNEEQRRAVTAEDGPQLVLAGAGSGKTRTIVHRIGFLIAERRIAPHRILAVTFTNKAARELRDRLQQLIGDDCGGVIAGTFHAVSLRFLRRYASALGYPQDFQVLDADDQLSLCKKVLKAQQIATDRLHPRLLLSWIEHCKHRGLTPEQAPEDSHLGIPLLPLYQRYQQELLRLGRMDFSDLLLNVVRLFREHEEIAAALRARFDHVLVDEYQDTNPVQHEWLVHLCCEHRNLTVVGDDDQSIYGWRGADVRGILDFERIWPGATIHRLQTNYRSTEAILRLANAVIAQNEARHEKRLVAVRSGGEIPEWRICQDEVEEAEHVVSFIQRALRDGIAPEQIAVLYRSHRQSLPIEQALRERGIAYRVVGGLSFFERMEVKDAVAYWALVQGCADLLHLLRVVNKPRRGIGAKTIERIEAAVTQAGTSPCDWLEGLPAADRSWGKVRAFAEEIAAVRSEAKKDADGGLWRVLERSGYLELLQAEGEIEAQTRIENLRALQAFVEQSLAEGLAPREVLDRIALLSSPEEVTEEDKGGIALMSLHRAKGLEFQAVVLIGLDEGLLPHQRAIEEGAEAIAEERRLLYVGITRARDRLLLTSARLRRLYGRDPMLMQPSRFLRQLPPGVVERIEPTPVAPTSGELMLGVRVRHPSFGEGVLIDCEGSGDAVRITVSFDRAGIKRLMLKYAPIEILD